jgi:hypothetical protein
MAVNPPQGSASMTWEEMNELQRLRRRDFLKLIGAGLALSGCTPRPVIDPRIRGLPLMDLTAAKSSCLSPAVA